MTYQRLWVGAWTVVVVLGAGMAMLLTSPLEVAVFGAAVGVVGWLAQVLTVRPSSRPVTFRDVSTSKELFRAAMTGGVVVAVGGGMAVSPALTWLLVLVAVTSAPPVLAWFCAHCPGSDDADPVLSWSDSQLEAAWLEAALELRRPDHVVDIAELAALRQRYLDELEERDPRAFARWLARAADDYRRAG
jgi:hypothetical protein